MYEFGNPQSETDVAAVQKEQIARKKLRYPTDWKNLNEENVMGSALGPRMYPAESTSEKAKKRLKGLLREGGYDFGDMDKRTGGLDYDAIMRGGDVK